MDAAVAISGDIEIETKFAGFLDEIFEAELARAPDIATWLGRATGKDRWPDLSEAGRDAEQAATSANLDRLDREFPAALMGAEARLTRRIFEYRERTKQSLDPFRDYEYPLTHMHGAHSHMPIILMMGHQIRDPSDAAAYLARLGGLGTALDQALDSVRLRARRGFVLPRLTFPKIIAAAGQMIEGAPFDNGPASPLLADFSAKLARLDLPEAERGKLQMAAASALETSVGPAYRRFIAGIAALAETVQTDHGLCHFAGGTDAYRAMLRRETTLDLTAEEIGRIGHAELERIHDEMRAIMHRVGHRGTLLEFFAWLRSAPQFKLSNDAAGQRDYVRRTEAIVARMQARLPELFGLLPKARLAVKPIDPFNQGSATAAYYNPPAEDGSRPGHLEVNLADVSQNPLYQMESLMHHEGVPGHHLQIALAMERPGLPQFRRHDLYNAHIEGWALYAEELPKEIGFYEDPYSDFGRLSMAAWRACRLVVDPGIHHEGWSRARAIGFMTENTAESVLNIATEIDRYFIFPAQATSYAIGLREIRALRRQTEAALGAGFDIRAFHDVLLGDGSVPLPVLRDLIEAHITARSARP
jgi:uncharacterized protein (DUF885 family)